MLSSACHTQRALVILIRAICPVVTDGIIFNVTGPDAAGFANAATSRTLCDAGRLREGSAAEESVRLQWTKTWFGG